MDKRFIILGLFLGVIGVLLAVKSATSPSIEKPQWQIYQNSKYGFQFSYPFSWQKEEWDLETATGYKVISDGTILYQGKFFSPSVDSASSPQAGSGQAGSFEILVWDNNSRAKILNWLTWFRHEDLTLLNLPGVENDEVAKISAVRYFQQQTARGKPLVYYFFTKDNLVFELTEERPDLVNLTVEEATQSAKLKSEIYEPILESFQFMVK